MKRLREILKCVHCHLLPFGSDSIILYVSPARGLSRKDWEWFREKVLKPAGFNYSGRGQSDWFKFLKGD
jgi:hypothetical protein